MSVLSLNVRGVGGVEKGRALSQLFKTTTPYIIILQETMVAETQAIETFFQTTSWLEFLWYYLIWSSRGAYFLLEPSNL